ncbi:MAG: hydrogenase maturation nickel metallochaperone HypA [Eubacteriales bacterium]|nr:hydrogenase maturation nickel metallochaperone HypA [Eubacteriales bacterium]
MHELGVVFHVIRNVKQVAEENQAQKINSVTLQVGEVSGIIHEYLTDCWKWAIKKEEILKESSLYIEPIQAITHCEACGKDYETVKYAKVCPFCQSENTYLLTGNEFLIKEIEVD